MKNMLNCADMIFKNSNIPDRTKFALLGYQNENPHLAYKKGLCQHDFEPGTFTLAEISLKAKFLKKRISFKQWLDDVLEQELSLLKKLYPSLFLKSSLEEIKLGVEKILNAQTEKGEPLKNEIWFQEYSDIFRRIILFLLSFNPDYELDLYPDLTHKRKKLAFSVLNWIETNKKPNLWEWLSVSIAAGLMGVDEKSNHAATSDIVRAYAISLKAKCENEFDKISKIGELLWEISNTKTRIDATNNLRSTLELREKTTIKILTFPDDYIETIFLLKYFDVLLAEFHNIEIDCVPRSIRCGNDANYNDILTFIKFFPNLLKASDRFRVRDQGPKLGTVNLLKLHSSILDLLLEANIVDARGARNYEMMQGINKETYFGFMVCREFSESTIGMFAEDRPLVYIRHSPNEKSFREFRKRGRRIEHDHMLCTVTAFDNKEKWETGLSAKESSDENLK
jgi:hypothetical protein